MDQQQQQPNQSSELFREEAVSGDRDVNRVSSADISDIAADAEGLVAAAAEMYPDGGSTSNAILGSISGSIIDGAQSSTAHLYGPDSVVGDVSTSGLTSGSELSSTISSSLAAPMPASAAIMEGSGVSSADLNIDFNVDSLNLDNLGGLDFDVSNLLSQVSASTIAAAADVPAFDFAGIMSSMQAVTESVSASMSHQAQQVSATKTNSKQASSSSSSSSEDLQTTPAPAPAPALPEPASLHVSAAAASANASQSVLEKASEPKPVADTGLASASTSPSLQVPAATAKATAASAASVVPTIAKVPPSSSSQPASLKTPVQSTQQSNLNYSNSLSNLPKSQSSVQQSPSPSPAQVRPNATAIRPTRPASMASAGQATSFAPSSSGASNMSSSPVSARPRLARPAANGPGASLTPQSRPVSGQGLSPARPGSVVPASTAGARPQPLQLRPSAAAAGAVRPRPGQGPASPARPGMRPVVRPRPLARPPQQGPSQHGAPRPHMRPGARPAMRPALSMPVSTAGPHMASGASTASSPSAPVQGSARSPVTAEPITTSAPAMSNAVRSVTAQAARTSNATGNSANGSTDARPRAGAAAAAAAVAAVAANGDSSATAAATAAQQKTPLPLSATSSTGKVTDDDDEQFLTESVLVSAPALIAAASSLESLYGLDGTFRSLCHGFAPTYAEWSTLNVLAVTWPQLETTSAGAGRRLAQRDISDVSSMTAADSARAAAERRPASSAIRLFRLHVEPPASWDAGSRLRPMAPSLLPLCDLRMQQQWDGASDDVGLTQQIADGTSLSVAPLSGWHGGASQAGLYERMRAASAPRCVWSADSRILATSDRAGRFELFQVEAELNSWRSVYHVDFDCPVVSCLWLGSKRKYGISRDAADKASSGPGASSSSLSSTAAAAAAAATAQAGSSGSAGSRWMVDSDISIKRLPFFGPHNTQGGYALLVVTADSQLVLVYQRDDKWVRVVSPLEPRRLDVRTDESTAPDGSASVSAGTGASARDDPWSNIPKGAITHADMMLVSKKWIYLAAHRAAASPVQHPHEPGAIADELKRNGAMTAPTVEVYRIQVEFASDYSPRLFATPLVVQPITLPVDLADAMDADADAEDASVARVTHIKLITALNPEVRPVEKNILGENHYFPLLFVSLGRVDVSLNADAFSTFVQVWRLEGAAHAQRSVVDLLRRPPPLKLSHLWTEHRRGLLLAVSANRAERQQLRYLFAKPGDKDYRALMLTWADGRVEMLRNYQDRDDRFDQCVRPVQAPRDCVIGSALSPHYTTYFQLVVRPCSVELGPAQQQQQQQQQSSTEADADSAPHTAVACVWNQSHACFRLGWTPFFSDHAASASESGSRMAPMSAPVQAYCGDLLAVRILNQEDPTDLVAILANMAVYEENQPVPDAAAPDDHASPVAIPMSRTLSQALYRACTLMAGALGVGSLELDPLAATTPLVRRTLGAVMQIHSLAQHHIQATSVGLLLHIAAVAEARVSIVHEHVIQTVSSSHSAFDVAKTFSDPWRRSFPSTAALVLWCIDLFVALVRDTYLYFNVRCPDGAGAMRRLFELDGASDTWADREQALLRAFRGDLDNGTGTGAGNSDGCVLSGGLPSRLALLFHRPTLDAIRSLMTFVSHVEVDLLRRVQILSRLPPNAASVPEYRPMVEARDMVVSTAQQLAHALEYLPVSMQRMKNFLADVQELYASDPECTSLSAQAVVVSTSTVAGPFRKHLPRVARSFAHFILELDVVDTHSSRPAAPSALVLHDTRWLGIVACRAGVPGLSDGATVFETPWRVQLPVRVADPKLIETGSDALVPAAELAEWEKEKSEFERALDEDNVLFDIDDPGFIFFDTSEPPSEAAQPGLGSTAFSAASARAAALAPVKITTKVPDFSDVVEPLLSRKRPLVSDIDIDHMFDTTMLLDSAFACSSSNRSKGNSVSSRPSSSDRDAASGCSKRQTRAPSDPAAAYSPSMTPHTAASSLSFAWNPSAVALGSSSSSSAKGRNCAAQHFVPHYSSVASTWADGRKGEELSSGWQFISTPRDPKLHIPTLLAQHAFSLAVLHQRHLDALKSPQLEPDSDHSDLAAETMSYCIDWSRSEGVVVEPTASAAICSAASLPTAGADAASGGQRLVQVTTLSASTVDSVDVIQKTMLAADSPTKICLRCGHATRKIHLSSSDNQEIGWISRFNMMCICGGSWIAT
ncbi:hypothetical protein LPJ64_003655 [Coemansia asiatica]|uniref:Mediator complex subunit 16 n=1 Tax=Coemansia asiatica TaxID=1052880 RepID=A0A9W7XKL7_9FUNG|nr:hypothetical protein LPJ64_003655 [Coemansia asiatica]